MTLVFRSTAITIVRCDAPSFVLATSGITCRRFGSSSRTLNVPSGRNFNRRALESDLRIGVSGAVNHHFGIDSEA